MHVLSEQGAGCTLSTWQIIVTLETLFLVTLTCRLVSSNCYILAHCLVISLLWGLKQLDSYLFTESDCLVISVWH